MRNKAFNIVTESMKTKGLQFNRESFVNDSKMMEQQIYTCLNKIPDNQKKLLYIPTKNTSISDIIDMLSDLSAGVNSKMYEYYCKEYYNAEEGSISEHMYEMMKKDLQARMQQTRNMTLFNKYFVDIMGNLCIDSKHVYVFLNALRNLKTTNKYGWKKINVGDFETNLTLLYNILRVDEFYNKPYFTGLLDVGGKVRKSEAEGFKIYLRKGFLYPTFRVDYGLEWTGCNQILANYVPIYTVPQGYKGYIFDEPFVALSCLVSKVTNTDYNVVMEQLKKQQTGVLYEELTPAFEDAHLRDLLSGRWSSFDTKLGKSIIDWYYVGEGNSSMYDFYDFMISDMIQNKTAERIVEFKDELSKTGVSANDCYIYWLSDTKFAIALKSELSINKVLPTMCKRFKALPAPNYTYILNRTYNNT